MKILVHTAITGEYEKPRNDIRVETLELFKDPMRSARMHKCLTPDFWDYDYSIWVDGNTSIKTPVAKLINELGEDDILVYKHWRDCTYEEAIAEIGCAENQEEIDDIEKQMEKYRKEGFPEHCGLGATTYVIRRHNKKIEEFNNMWWAEICKGSKQDQLSFNYCVWRLGIKLRYFEEEHFDIHKINSHFNYFNHNDYVNVL